MSSELKVLIIGSGLGGLSLAQSLRRAGIPFDIYERDHSPFERPQGYHLHLDADAINTVHDVLPPKLQELFQQTSQWTKPYTSIMSTENLRVVKRLLTKDDIGTGVWPAEDPETPRHANVDRAVLRQILLSDLGGSIHYGKKFERYESIGADSVMVHFADRTVATGSVLVGADGISSRVRGQRAPASGTMDAGITAIYGRLSVESVKKLGPLEALQDIFLIGSDQRKVFLGLGSVVFPTHPTEAVKKLEIASDMHAQESYAVCIVGGRHKFFPENTRTATSKELQAVAANLIAEWGGNAASLVRAGDPDSFFAVHMRTSIPTNLQSSTNVTLLGDAIHSMTPSLGRGANLAMRHGALLGRHLKKVAQSESPLAAELAAYEQEMTEYGFRVVREAAKVGQQRMAQNLLEGEA